MVSGRRRRAQACNTWLRLHPGRGVHRRPEAGRRPRRGSGTFRATSTPVRGPRSDPLGDVATHQDGPGNKVMCVRLDVCLDGTLVRPSGRLEPSWSLVAGLVHVCKLCRRLPLTPPAVTVWWHGAARADVAAERSGTWSVTVRCPLRPGVHLAPASCGRLAAGGGQQRRGRSAARPARARSTRTANPQSRPGSGLRHRQSGRGADGPDPRGVDGPDELGPAGSVRGRSAAPARGCPGGCARAPRPLDPSPPRDLVLLRRHRRPPFPATLSAHAPLTVAPGQPIRVGDRGGGRADRLARPALLHHAAAAPGGGGAGPDRGRPGGNGSTDGQPCRGRLHAVAAPG